ncbi:CHAT domain-containing protein [Mycobacterium sp. MBM]|nr:CHAT domain-containing protein [Mycobacterium sp. MBM]
MAGWSPKCLAEILIEPVVQDREFDGRSARRQFAMRCLRRYDLLMSAHRAEVALQINRSNPDGTALFDADNMVKRASTAHLRLASAPASDFDNDATRVRNLAHAGAIVEYVELMKRNVASWFDATAIVEASRRQDLGWLPKDGYAPSASELYEHALDILGHFRSADIENTSNVKFLELRAETYWFYVRSQRLEDHDDSWLAQLLTLDEDRFLAGTGREHSRLHLECERLAGLCQSGNAELTAYLSTGRTEGAAAEAPRSWLLGRLQLIHAVAQYQDGRIGAPMLLHILTDKVPNRRPQTVESSLRTGERDSPEFILHRLNAALCAMDVAHLNIAGGSSDDALFRTAEAAVAEIQRLFRLWRVLARSQSPIAATLRACLGDIADICAAHSGAINDLGFRVATLIKQNTLSHLLEDQSLALPTQIQNHLKEIARIDNDLWDTEVSPGRKLQLRTDRESAREQLERQLHGRLHLMSLDYLDPSQVDTGQILDRLAGRLALDYVWIESTSRPNQSTWYRTFISSDRNLIFARPENLGGIDLNGRSIRDDRLRELSALLLPPELTDAPPTEPADLLISPHRSLDVIPWAGLELDDSGTRLVEHFTISLSPCLANLAPDPPPAVTGPALAHLVAEEITLDGSVFGQRLSLDTELRSWGQPTDHAAEGAQSLVWDGCEVLPAEHIRRTLTDSAADFGFLHLAAHGGGEGLRGTVYLPEPFTAAEAFSVRWPAAVFLAVCHSGELAAGRFTEPLAFCMAVLAGGAYAVAAGVGRVSDAGAGFLAGHVVSAIRDGTVKPLPEFLRAAQLEALRRQIPVWQWSRFVTYIR